jgi:hypothetical protein
LICSLEHPFTRRTPVVDKQLSLSPLATVAMGYGVREVQIMKLNAHFFIEK